MRSMSNGAGQSTFNGPSAVDWARELMLKPVTSWTLTIGQDPA